MEQMNELQVAAKDFKKWYDQINNAKTFEEADEAKVEGLKSWIKYTQQLNRVRGEFLNLATDTRARLGAEVRNRVKELTKSVTTVAPQNPGEPEADFIQNLGEPKPKKATKKTSKKAKK